MTETDVLMGVTENKTAKIVFQEGRHIFSIVLILEI